MPPRQRHVEHPERGHRESRARCRARSGLAARPYHALGDQRDPDDGECERDHDGDVHVDDAGEVDEPRATGEDEERARGDGGEIRLRSGRPRRPRRSRRRDGRGGRRRRDRWSGSSDGRRCGEGRGRQRRAHRACRRPGGWIGRRRISGRRTVGGGSAGGTSPATASPEPLVRSHRTATPIAISARGQNAPPPIPNPTLPGMTASPSATSPKPSSCFTSARRAGMPDAGRGSTIHPTR